jgi:excisionase family DNA binding protein
VAVEILRLAEAARRLGISTLEMVRMVSRREIRYVLVDGVPRIPEDVVDEYRRKAS